MAQPAGPDTIFCAAIEIADEDERAAYLARSCGDDQELRARVGKLVAAHFRAGSFLEQPAASPQDTGAFNPASLRSSQAPTAGPEGQSTTIGPYKLLQLLGEGGMGAVFMAEQTQPVQRRVALKVIKSGLDSRQVIARFEAERQALALMDHPNIARVLDAGTTDTGRPFFVMELVKGVPITRYCDQHRLTPRERLELFIPVCQAVQHAHQKGIIHRDLKPSNVLVSLYDGRPVPKVIDFGVAKAAGPRLTEKTLFTEVGQIVGTLEYMSPEQAELNQLDVDTRSDIYSLGVLMYELLTGTTPLERARLKEAAFLEVLRLIREEEPPRPSTRISTAEGLPAVAASRGLEPRKLSALVRGELDWIAMRALEKDRNRRYETPGAFAADIERYLRDEPVAAGPPSAWYRLKKFAHRKKLALMTAGLALCFILLLGGCVGWVVRDRGARREQTATDIDVALREAQRLQDQQKWPEALAVVRQAQALLNSGGGDEELRQRVRERAADLDLLVRLEDSRLTWAAVKGNTLNYREADAAFARAFQEHGIDVETLAPAEAGPLLRARAIRVELAAALDAWADMLRIQGKPAWRDRLAAARAADPDSFRDQIRAAIERGDGKELADLASADEAADLPAPTLLLLAVRLGGPAARERSVALLTKAQRLHPGDFWINFTLGNQLQRLGPSRIDDSIRYLSVALALRPGSPIAHDNLGSSLRLRGRPDEAVAEHREAIRLQDNAVSRCALGTALLSQDRLDEAVAELREVLRLKPDFVEAHSNLGLALKRQGHLDDAIAEYQEALRLDDDDADTHLNLGNAYLAKGRPDDAINEYRKALRLNDDDLDTHVSLGNALVRKRQLDEAIEQFRQAIKLDKGNAGAHVYLGEALLARGRIDDGIVECREAIRLDPNAANPRANLGLVLADKGRPAEALAELNEALRLAPKSPQIGNALAWVLASCPDPNFRDPVRAIKLAEKALEVEPGRPNFWNTLGVARYRAGDWKASIEALRKSMQIRNGGDASQCYYLAMAYYQLSSKNEARDWYDRAVQWHEKNQPGNEDLRRLRAEAAKLLELKQ
jgi:serine/threonine protein kinase/Flp pilus assembly protein TadD